MNYLLIFNQFLFICCHCYCLIVIGLLVIGVLSVIVACLWVICDRSSVLCCALRICALSEIRVSEYSRLFERIAITRERTHPHENHLHLSRALQIRERHFHRPSASVLQRTQRPVSSFGYFGHMVFGVFLRGSEQGGQGFASTPHGTEAT